MHLVNNVIVVVSISIAFAIVLFTRLEFEQ